MDDALYWSPYVQQNRSIDKILIAFHAFANIVLFYRDCLAAGMMDNRETAQEEIADNLQHLGPMGEHLQHSRGLSPAGRTLFELLRGRLFG
jgi:HEXXH motif-containing protein